MSPTVLGVGAQTDGAVARLLGAALAARGARWVWLELDRFPVDVGLRAALEGGDYGGWLRTPAGERVDLGGLRAAWVRRLDVGATLPREGLPPGARGACLTESSAAALGVLESLACPVIDRPYAIIRAEHKAWQLVQAAQVGLSLSPTLVSNDPEGVHAWAAGAPPLIAKMLAAQPVQVGGQTQVMQTSAVSAEDLQELGGLELAPLTLQHRVPKALEARVVVVGERWLAAGLDSQRLAGAEVDWRRGGAGLYTAFTPLALPDEVGQRLVALNRRLGVRFGSADLILTPAGEWVFLEMNPGGNWDWLQEHTGLDIAGALADLLLAEAP